MTPSFKFDKTFDSAVVACLALAMASWSKEPDRCLQPDLHAPGCSSHLSQTSPTQIVAADGGQR